MHRSPALAPLLAAATAFLFAAHLPAATISEPVAGFRVGPGIPASHPLTLHPDGSFYGTGDGGDFSLGTVFRLSPGGGIEWLSFSGYRGESAGEDPSCALLPRPDGWVWGTTQSNGVGNHTGTSTVFRFRPRTWEFQTIVNFGNSPFLGKYSSSGLVADGSGWLWGVCASGGTNDRGVIYKIHEHSGAFKAVVTGFTNTSGAFKGLGPASQLYFDGNQTLWGVTSGGGAGVGGTVFRINTVTEAFTTVGEFSNSGGSFISGFQPKGPLTPDGLGFLWGVTGSGGANANGILFKVDMTGTTTAATTAVLSFTGSAGAAMGSAAHGALVADDQGYLWGVTNQGGSGQKGTLYQLDPADGTFTTKVQFGSLTGPLATLGSPATPLTYDGNGFLWGLAYNVATSRWAFYKYEIASGIVTKISDYSADSHTPHGKGPAAGLTGAPGTPWMYGTTLQGGDFNFGTLFRYNVDTDRMETLVHFTGNSGAAVGNAPEARLHIHTDGTVWGVTRFGGIFSGGLGTVFKYNPATQAFTNILSFSGNTGGTRGAHPRGKLTTGSDGFIWGTTSVGNDGTLFKINPADGVMSLVKTFTGSNSPDGAQPFGGLVLDSSGVLWGATNRGGGVAGSATGYGTLFKYDPAGTGTFTSVLKFTGTNTGAIPAQGPADDLFMDGAGLIWGRALGGVNGNVFTFNPATSAFTFVTDTTLWPLELKSAGDLHLHNDGEYYGTQSNAGRTPQGEPAGGGMIYRRRTDQPAVSSASNTVHPDDPNPLIVSLTGSVDLNGAAGSYQFEWGPTTALGRTTPAVPVSAGAAPSTPTAALPVLVGYTTYYCRLRLQGPEGPVLGPVSSFVTRQLNSTAGVPEISVESPLGVVLTDDVSTVDVGSVVVGESRVQAVIIHNVGQAGLSGLGASISGPDADRFEITTDLPAAPDNILPGMGASSTSLSPATALVITYTPDGEAAHTATLTITSNDTDENPFTFTLTGEGIILPDIYVEQPAGLPLASDGSSVINFGSSDVGTATDSLEFVIGNSSLGSLEDIQATLVGDQAGDFELLSLPDTSLPGGGSGAFTVGFTPSTSGLRTATLRITSSDPDESPFDITLTGTGIGAPELVLEAPEGNLVLAGGSVPFGSVTMNTSASVVFVVKNTGNAPLANVSATVVGQPQYAVTSAPAATVAPGGSTTFTITLTPASALPVIATLRITSNDPDESSFDITLNGSGAPLPNPVFATQPASAVATLGAPHTFSPVVTGSAPINYQWKKGAANIPGAAGQGLTYTIASVKAADAGLYSMVASNNTPPAATSATARLGVVTRGPAAVSVNVGKVLTLSCTATPPAATGYEIRYSWSRNGTALPENDADYIGVKTKALKINNIAADEGGTYTCDISMTPTGGTPFFGNSGITTVTVLTVPQLAAFDLPPSLISQQVTKSLATIGSVPAKFTATGLPAGVTLNATTGLLDGRPTVAKSYSIKFTVTNAAGSSSLTKIWDVTAFDSSILGSYNGLVTRHPQTNFGLGGFVQITVAPTGVVSGSITLAGQKWPVTGVINTAAGQNPTATLTAKRTPAALGNLLVNLTIQNGGDSLSGTIRDPQFNNIDSDILAGGGQGGFTGGTVSTAVFNGPRGIQLDGNQNIYVADTANHIIRRIGTDDEVLTVAGAVSTPGASNGTGAAAGFNGPEGLGRDNLGFYYVADTGNRTIRKLTGLLGETDFMVTTIAGSGSEGAVNGTGTAASFSAPCAIAFDPANNMIVVDRGNHTLRKITPAGVVTTFAGKPGVSGHKDGGGAAALFNSPRGIVYDAALKAFFVADTGNRVIRKVTTTGAVTTYAGSPGVPGEADGVLGGARFLAPVGITSNGAGTLFVADSVLVQITPGGITSVVTSPIIGPEENPVALAFHPHVGGVFSVDDHFNSIVRHKLFDVSSSASFSARRQIWTAHAGPPAAFVGLYTAGFETTQLADPEYPQGEGYAALTITKTGAATWTGRTGDGTAFTFGTFLRPGNDVILHALQYKNTASLQGVVTVDPANGDLASATVPPFDWYKLAQPLASTDRAYKAGFPVHSLVARGGKYTPANNLVTFLGLGAPPANARLHFVLGGLPTFFDVDFAIAAPSKVTAPTHASGAKVTFTPASGIYTGTFNHGTPARKATFNGILVRDAANTFHRGFGHFLLPATTATTSPVLSGPARVEDAP